MNVLIELDSVWVGVCSLVQVVRDWAMLLSTQDFQSKCVYPHPLRTVVRPLYWEPRLEAVRSTWNRVESVGPDAVRV